MSLPNQKPAPTVPASPKTFEEAVALLAKQPKMDNPYANGFVGETTNSAKARLRMAHRFESARGAMEVAAQKAVGITGGYGRVPSVLDELRARAKNSPTLPFSIESFAAGAEKFYQANNVGRKVSKDGSEIYSKAILDSFRLLGLVVMDPKSKDYTITPAFKAILLATPAK